MRKLFLLIALIMSVQLLNAQAPFPSVDEIKQFKASKTCIVLEDDPFSSFNIYIRKAVEDYWKITPYEFIKWKEFNVRRSNPAYSFVVITQTNFEKDKSRGLYDFINLLQGKNVNKLSELPEICAVPLAFSGASDLEYTYKLGPILSFMQKHALKIEEDPSLNLKNYLKEYNRNIPEIKEKTILIDRNDLTPEISSLGKIKAIYSGKIEIVSNDEIISAIENKSPNTVIVHKVGPRGNRESGFCFIMLLGITDSEMYYYSLHNVDNNANNGLSADDLKQLEKN